MLLLNHLDLEPLSNIFIQIGDFAWQKYSLMILIGIAIAFLLGIREGNKLGIHTNDIIDGVLIIVPLSIVGTRLWYVMFEWGNTYWPYFLEHGFGAGLLNVINISSGGLAIHGGFITAFISAYVYTKKKGINIFSAFDIMVPGFLIAQASGRWGNFFNQEAHGGIIGGTTESGTAILNWDQQRAFLSETLRLPDWITNQMFIQETNSSAPIMGYYHPTFLYESMWNIVGFIIVLVLRRTKLIKNGDLLAFYLIWYGVGRFFIEGMRTDSLYIGNTGLRTAQIISIIMVIGAILYLVFTRKVMNVKSYAEVLEENKGLVEPTKFDTFLNNTGSKIVSLFKK